VASSGKRGEVKGEERKIDEFEVIEIEMLATERGRTVSFPVKERGITSLAP